jgi:hypothetical protein
VHFSCNNAGIAAAFQAVSVVDNQTFDSVLYNVELSKNLLRQFNEIQDLKRRGLSKSVSGSFSNMPGTGSMSITAPAHHHHHHPSNDRMNNYRDHNNFRSAPEPGFNNYQANNNSNHQHGMNHRYPQHPHYDEMSMGATAGRSISDAVNTDDFYNPEKSFGSRRSVSMPPTAAIGNLISQYPQKNNNYHGGSSRAGGNTNNYPGGNSHSSKSHNQQYQGDSDAMPPSVIGASTGGALLPPRLPSSAAFHRQNSYSSAIGGSSASGKGSQQTGGSSLPSRSRPNDPSSALFGNANGDFNMDYFQAVAPNTNITPPSGHGMYGGPSSFLDDMHSATGPLPLEPNSRSSSGHTTSSNGTHLSVSVNNNSFNQGGDPGLHSLSRSNSGNYRKHNNNQSHNDPGNGSISRSNSLPSTGNMFKQQQHGKNSSDTVPGLQVVDPGLLQISRGISGSSSAYFKNSSDLQLVDRPLSRNNSGHTVGGGGGGSTGLFNSKTAGSGHHHNGNGYFKPSSSIAAVDEHFSMQHFDNPTGGSSGNSSFFKHSSSSVGAAVTDDHFSLQHFDAMAGRIETTHSSLFSDEPKINQWTSALITDPKFDASSDKEHKRVCLPPGLRSSERGSSPPGLIGSDRSLSPPGLQKPVRSSSSLVIMDPNGVEVLPLVTASPADSSSSSQLDLIVKRIPGLSLKDEPVEVKDEPIEVKEEPVEVLVKDEPVEVEVKEEIVVEESPAEEEEATISAAVEENLSYPVPEGSSSGVVDELPTLKNQQVDGPAVGLQESCPKTKQRTLKDFFRPVAK